MGVECKVGIIVERNNGVMEQSWVIEHNGKGRRRRKGKNAGI
jgi:hypothetical protein